MVEPVGKVLHTALHLQTLPAAKAAEMGAALLNEHCTELLGMAVLVIQLPGAAC